MGLGGAEKRSSTTPDKGHLLTVLCSFRKDLRSSGNPPAHQANGQSHTEQYHGLQRTLPVHLAMPKRGEDCRAPSVVSRDASRAHRAARLTPAELPRRAERARG